MAIQKSNIWTASSLKTNYTWHGALEAYWEVSFDPISDDFTPDDMSATELFEMWVDKVSQKYPDGLIPILWCVTSRDAGKFEFMPFQFQNNPLPFNFLTYFTWPVHKETGEQLNWLELPVIDKFWNHQVADKGGFIQEVTGWKPGILQPFVYLPSLLESASG